MRMMSEMEHIPRDRGLRELWYRAVALNVVVSCLVVGALYWRGEPWVVIGGALAVLFLCFNIMLYIVFQYEHRDILGTLSFYIELDGPDFETNTELYKRIISRTESYLDNNRVGYSPSTEGFRFGGITLPYSKVLSLDGTGRKLKIRREKAGRTRALARVILGPVTGPDEAVPRKLMGKLRSELELYTKERR